MGAQPDLGLRLHALDRARRASIAILHVVSRKWLAMLTSAEETSTQVEACFLAALDAEDRLSWPTSWPPRAARGDRQRRPRQGATTWPTECRCRCCWRSATTARRCARSPPASSSPVSRSPSIRPAAHPDGSGLDRDPVRARQGRMAAPGEDPRPWRARRRARPGPGRVQHRPAARRPSATSPPTTNTKAEVMPSAGPAATAWKLHG